MRYDVKRVGMIPLHGPGVSNRDHGLNIKVRFIRSQICFAATPQAEIPSKEYDEKHAQIITIYIS